MLKDLTEVGKAMGFEKEKLQEFVAGQLKEALAKEAAVKEASMKEVAAKEKAPTRCCES